MSDAQEMSVNKRLGREKELKKKMKATIDRYEAVFGKVITVNQLKGYLDEEEKLLSLQFLRDRMGMLSEPDITFLRNMLKGSAKAPDMPPVLHEELEEIDELDEESSD